jgi:hypothetical protein
VPIHPLMSILGRRIVSCLRLIEAKLVHTEAILTRVRLSKDGLGLVAAIEATHILVAALIGFEAGLRRLVLVSIRIY